MSHVINIKTAVLKAAVVLIPSYTAAWLTDKMVWVVPTLAAAGFFAANIGVSNADTTRRVDEDGPDEGGDEEGAVTDISDISGG